MHRVGGGAGLPGLTETAKIVIVPHFKRDYGAWRDAISPVFADTPESPNNSNVVRP